MSLIIHIAIAVVSLVVASLALARPSKGLVRLSYLFVAGTLGTGTLLVLQGASLWHMCLSGLVYTLVAVGATELSRRRIAVESTN